MAGTATKSSSAAKAPATRKRTTSARRPETARRATTARRPTLGVDRSVEMSEEVVASLEKAQRAAIDAVRSFVDTVDHTLPALPHGDGPSRRQEIVDSALDMADRLVQTQYDFIHKVIDSTGKSLRS